MSTATLEVPTTRALEIPATLPKPTVEQRAVSDAKLTLTHIERLKIKLHPTALALIQSWAACSYTNSRAAPAVFAISEAVQGEIARRKDLAAKRETEANKPGFKPMVMGGKKKK